jgi:hypothetical protein
MAPTNRISHNVFSAIAYTKQNAFEVIFLTGYDTSVGIGVVIYLQH